MSAAQSQLNMFGVRTAALLRAKFLKLTLTRSCHEMAGPLVETDRLGQVFFIAINRPEKRNCVNAATAAALSEAFQHFEENDDLLVAILHGRGGHFCAGYDLAELSAASDWSPAALRDGHGFMGPSRKLFSKPVIAAVEGHAVAGGLELALMADLRVADDSAVFGVFCRRFGVPLVDGGTARLPALIGLSRALDLILTGRPVPAREALQLGLANRVVATGTALGEATKLARTLCQFPQRCLRQDRRAAYHAAFDAASLDAALDAELATGLELIAEEAIPGAKRFVEGAGKGGSFELETEKSKL